MMLRLNLAWCLGTWPHAKGGNFDGPTWCQVDALLAQLRGRRGSLSLTIREAKNGPERLELFVDRKDFVLNLTEVDDDGAIIKIRTYDNLNEPPTGLTLILGNGFPSRSICSDFSIAERSFKEFFEIGDVSRDILR